VGAYAGVSKATNCGVIFVHIFRTC
jgi:hypothetical protein